MILLCHERRHFTLKAVNFYIYKYISYPKINLLNASLFYNFTYTFKIKIHTKMLQIENLIKTNNFFFFLLVSLYLTIWFNSLTALSNILAFLNNYQFNDYYFVHLHSNVF